MSKDFIKRFIFQRLPIKGSFVNLSNVWQNISSQKSYPKAIKQIMGELIVANILMTSNLKLKGKITAQLENNPMLKLLVSECTSDLKIRATAKFEDKQEYQYEDIVGSGNLLISIDSLDEGRIYQSIVELNKLDLVSSLNEYMILSEQLNSLFIINFSSEKLTGILLQQLPDRVIDPKEVNKIFELMKRYNDELKNNNIEDLLQNLYPEEDIFIFDEQNIEFFCTCNYDKVINILRMLGKEEIISIFNKEKVIKVNCDFCNKLYEYTINDLDIIFNNLSSNNEFLSKEIH